jgi:predicted HTH domain antitoxin
MKMETIVGRITSEQKKLLEKIAKIGKVDRSKVLREVVDIGIRQKLIELSLESFRKNRISLAKAAELAGVSLWEMIEFIKEKKEPIHYTREDLEKDLEALGK